MRIGELASEAGVSVRVLRHYEAQGLAHSERKPNGYRDYPPLAVERVRRIRALLECGFSTRQIRQVLPCLGGWESFDPEACATGLERHVAKLRELDALIGLLKQRRRRLTRRLALFGVSLLNRDGERSQDALEVHPAPVLDHAAGRGG
jgi:DNA-binding transcriptional MerR regulator